MIEAFKKRAKALLEAVKANDSKAVARVKVYLHDGVKDIGLMRVQYVIAREAGFAQWNALIRASEDELRAALEKVS